MAHSAPGPERIFEIVANHLMVSRVLQVAAELGICAILAERPASAKEVAQRCGASERGMELLLTACVALGVLVKEGELYRNAPSAQEALARGEEGREREILEGLVTIYEDWLGLDSAVRTGQPVARPSCERGEASLVQWALDMHASSQPYAQELVRRLDLSGRERVLDVGGGVGTYSIAFCQRYPGLGAIVLELPQVAGLARRVVEHQGLGERITVQSGDYTRDPFPRCDVVLLCNVLHQEGRRMCDRLLGKAFAALAPGGLIVVQDVFFNAEKTGPLAVALAALSNLIYYQGGAYTVEELSRWLVQAGFGQIMARPMLAPGVMVVTARKLGGSG